ncbi:hypothetical protein DFP74_5634 [Nocardiopsis sp. Huas11]|uniref:DUF1963 domain-containing protein n=1 Tax=Nocardiopsis sp. Huas11 TaxID=2183912 RepID=UPI000EB412E9|nr:DUF1963 domain-containing protein [Nocardiopsis sp. Huas11]RKS09889.1 hypothetical protein DFP74_5634 [Nocardiopsis sp. Huas11]
MGVEEFLPELGPLRRGAVRLHPRRGEPGAHQSSVGGPLLWPEGEPWPLCTAEHEAWGSEPSAGPVPFVPVVQLFRSDAPDAGFPEGTDLLQVLWCPHDHEPALCPEPRVVWRETARIGAAAARRPVLDDAPAGSVPVPCVVHPEAVVEYPGWDDMGPAMARGLWGRARRMEERTGWGYEEHLSTAPGIKLGGYASGAQGSVAMDCGACGGGMDLLLTVASWEYDPASWKRWLPVEERTDADGERGPFSIEDGLGAQGVAGLMLGDVGSVFVFECRRCPERPIGHAFVCS